MSARSSKEMNLDIERLRNILNRSRTIGQLTKKFNVDRYTIYRWMKILERDGFQIVRIGVTRPTRYVVLP